MFVFLWEDNGWDLLLHDLAHVIPLPINFLSVSFDKQYQFTVLPPGDYVPVSPHPHQGVLPHLLDDGRSNRGEAIPLCGFNFYFPNSIIKK